MPGVKIVFFFPLVTRHHSALVAPLSAMGFVADISWLLGAVCWMFVAVLKLIAGIINYHLSQPITGNP